MLKISEHAILRYLQRFKGLDLTPIVAEMREAVGGYQHNNFINNNDSKVVIRSKSLGVCFVVRDNTLITIYDIDTKKPRQKQSCQNWRGKKVYD